MREKALMANLGVTSANKRRCFGTTTCVSMYVDIPEELSNATMATNRFLPDEETRPANRFARHQTFCTINPVNFAKIRIWLTALTNCLTTIAKYLADYR